MADIILQELADNLDSRLIAEIVNYSFPGASQKTVEAYRVDIKQYVNFCQTENQPVWSKDSLLAFVTRYKEENRNSKTINRKISAIKKALAGIADNHLPPKEALLIKQALSEVKGVKLNTNVNHVTRAKVLTKEEISRLLDRASDRLGLIIEFLYHSGCRVSELCGIRLQDIQEKDNYLIISILGKGNKLRNIKVKKELVNQVHGFFSGNKYLFETQNHTPYRRQYISDEIRKLGKRVLGKTISAHVMRHTTATILIQETKKVKAVSEFLGHHSTSITLDMYHHEELDMEDLGRL